MATSSYKSTTRYNFQSSINQCLSYLLGTATPNCIATWHSISPSKHPPRSWRHPSITQQSRRLPKKELLHSFNCLIRHSSFKLFNSTTFSLTQNNTNFFFFLPLSLFFSFSFSSKNCFFPNHVFFYVLKLKALCAFLTI